MGNSCTDWKLTHSNVRLAIHWVMLARRAVCSEWSSRWNRSQTKL